VTSQGFREWEESFGAGKHIRIAPGKRLTLDAQLDPSNPLTERIPAADENKYLGIRDAKDWRNPYQIVRVDGFEIVGVTDPGSPLTIDALVATLEGLPDSAWPYGRVIAAQESSIVGGQSDQPRINASRDLLVQRLSQLGLIVNF